MNRGFSLLAAIILIAGLAFYFLGNKPVTNPTPQPDSGGGPVVTGDPAPSGETDTDTPPTPQEVFYLPVGQLDNRGTGLVDPTVWSPDMRFPIKSGKAYANSQTFGFGGMNGPPANAKGLCDERNYVYPWQDTYCETRSNNLSTPRCAKKKSIHQGQDIRPATCEFQKHMAVAAEKGQIFDIGSYRVVLSADLGRTYNYLHLKMSDLRVVDGQEVEKGQEIGWVDDDFGGTSTTLHLHFEIVMAAPGKDGVPTTTHVSPYMSLVTSYERLQAEEPGTQ